MAVVTYKTLYHDKGENMMTLYFGLGEAISVNAIIGLPTFREWTTILDVDDSKAASKTLNQYFDLSFQYAVSGLPPNVPFNKEYFSDPYVPILLAKL